ncbi:hypothetical protein [Plebeiibacterium sediminum]|uniref:Transposase IS200-like domain-containing protein n=1 Tax=Plebeiibacterium sediminum TaxID=2992112 RepID=A0AAE3SF55_9BACT|nr:hypothetical protein [Plebeiobacterium sediminum]MCW3787110.1 hypothetical protein [Plebeiobacterium sediminum]
MKFQTNHLFHIYNQGNNRQQIFFESKNYLFFLNKIRIHILPYCDILAWCLMPNHFHLMVRVNKVELTTANTEGFAQSEALGTKNRTLNQSIGLMLRSYTNAINKRYNRTGSLFRKETKAECITYADHITPSFFNSDSGYVIPLQSPENQYPQICFYYILNNPVAAGIVCKASDWDYSSAKDVLNLRNGNLINKDAIMEYGLTFR